MYEQLISRGSSHDNYFHSWIIENFTVIHVRKKDDVSKCEDTSGRVQIRFLV